MTEVEKDEIRALFKNTKKGQKAAEDTIAMLEKAEEKARCTFPLSLFYNYEEEVPKNVRASTPEDCEKCEEPCEEKHCLITENDGEEDEKEKKCEGHCPFCGSSDIFYGVRYNVGDSHYHQRCVCEACDSCFIEVSEMVYRSTLLTEEKA